MQQIFDICVEKFLPQQLLQYIVWASTIKVRFCAQMLSVFIDLSYFTARNSILINRHAIFSGQFFKPKIAT